MGWMILIGIIVGALVLIFVVIVKAQLKKPSTGLAGMIGEVGMTLGELDPNGKVRIHGREVWNATNLFPGEVIKRGEKVEVVRIEGTTLVVKKREV